ncbi:Hypothetical predicted protein [Podarcis lilfordi]|uniref:Uncharacterized protein n=1 Tax=Podarcis lilfordi TaxID=74358 RepID=A0AA35L3G5_9SAUR|nr:Hypothetical predicted protein [Podarcis lilfordi]
MAVFCLNCICSFIYIYNGCNTLQLFLFIALAGKYHFLLSMDPSEMQKQDPPLNKFVFRIIKYCVSLICKFYH